MLKKTTEQFIIDVKKVHGNRYDYSLVNYTGNKRKIKIICKKHGIFEQRPDYHLRGNGCQNCMKNKKLNTEMFIQRSEIIHNNKYDYSLTNYINTDVKVIIICPIHGEFKQTPHTHLRGVKCPNCSHNKQKTTEQFIKRSKEIHGDKYDYSLVKYEKIKKKIKILCYKHGIFEQTPSEHLKGSGCPICKSSKGELKIIKLLNGENIIYDVQKTFNDCKYKYKLKFDFYLPDYNTCIEFDGEQHFNKYRFEKNDEKLKIRQIRDKIKNEYCLKNNIHLLRIRYDENIEKILLEYFKQY